MPKRMKLHLYRDKDLDLISLYLHDEKAFKKHIPNALKATANNSEYTIPVPPVGFANNYQGYLRPVTTVQLFIDDDAMTFLEKAKPRMMRQLMLISIRNHMERLPYENCLKGDGIDFNRVNAEFNEMFPDDPEDKPKKAEKPKVEKNETKPAKSSKTSKKEPPAKTSEQPELVKPTWQIPVTPEAPSGEAMDEDEAFDILDGLAHMRM